MASRTLAGRAFQTLDALANRFSKGSFPDTHRVDRQVVGRPFQILYNRHGQLKKVVDIQQHNPKLTPPKEPQSLRKQ
jgi:hypothetical protein